MELSHIRKMIILLPILGILTFNGNSDEINAEMKNVTNSTTIDNINGTDMSKVNATESNLPLLDEIYITIPIGAANPSSNEFYSPDDVDVKRGTLITWTNNDNTIHTVTSGSPVLGFTGVFDSGIMAPLQTFSYEFEKNGDYEYFCTLHPFMIGKIVVTG